MSYHQITAAERYTLSVLRQQGLTAAAIARVLGRHRSTIGREVRRNRSTSDGAYRVEHADWMPGGADPTPVGTGTSGPRPGRWSGRGSPITGVRNRSPGACGATGDCRSATRRSIATSGSTVPRAAPCTSTCAGPASSAASATGVTIAAGAWPRSG